MQRRQVLLGSALSTAWCPHDTRSIDILVTLSPKDIPPTREQRQTPSPVWFVGSSCIFPHITNLSGFLVVGRSLCLPVFSELPLTSRTQDTVLSLTSTWAARCPCQPRAD